MFNGLKLVTPLERAASGLVVYTQEYAISRKLVEEGKLVEQEYVAQVRGQLSEGDLPGCNVAWRTKGGRPPP